MSRTDKNSRSGTNSPAKSLDDSLYYDIFENMLDGFAYHELILDPTGAACDYRFLEVNPAFEKITGLKRSKIVGRRVLDVLPDTEEYWIRTYGSVVTTGEPKRFENYSSVLDKHFEVVAYKSGENKFVTIFYDISGRKLAEKEAEEIQLLLRTSIESPNDMIILSINKNYEYLYFNSVHQKAMRTAYGREVAIGMNILDCITNDDDRIKSEINYGRALKGESHSTIEEYGDLQRSYYETRYNPIYNNKEIIGATAFSANITERVLIEKKLQESEEQLRWALEGTNDGLWDVKMSTGEVYLSPRGCEILGYKPDELASVIKVWDQLVHPDDMPLTNARLNDHVEGRSGIFDVEQRLRMKSGEWKWIRSRGKVVARDPQGNPVRMTGTHSDISDRKSLETQREADRIEKNSLINSTDDLIWSVDNDLRLIAANNAFLSYSENLTGLTLKRGDYVLKGNIYSDIQIKFWIGLYKEVLIGKAVKNEFYTPNSEKEGPSWYEFNLSPIISGKEITGAACYGRNITSRKLAEERLFSSELKYRQLFDQMMNGFAVHEIICDQLGTPVDYRYLEVNKEFCRISGFSPSELIGKTRLEVLPDTDPRLFEKYGKVALTGQDTRFEHFSNEVNKVFEVTAYSPQYGQFATFLNDITERKKAEKEIIDSKEKLELLSRHLEIAREEERASIAREIHDELGQSLTAMQIDLRMALDSAGNEKLTKQRLQTILDIAKSVSGDVQRISSQLRPSILDDLGLVAAIEWYCETFRKRTGLNFSVDLPDIEMETSKNDIAVFRVVQESLTNIARHAKAKNVAVSVKKTISDLIVTVTDDGIGFSQDLLKSSQSLGLIGMRERMNHINGRLEIKSDKGKGTSITIFVPTGEIL